MGAEIFNGALMLVKTDCRVVAYGCVRLRVFVLDTTFTHVFLDAFVKIERRGGRPGVRDKLDAFVKIELL